MKCRSRTQTTLWHLNLALLTAYLPVLWEWRRGQEGVWSVLGDCEVVDVLELCSDSLSSYLKYRIITIMRVSDYKSTEQLTMLACLFSLCYILTNKPKFTQYAIQLSEKRCNSSNGVISREVCKRRILHRIFLHFKIWKFINNFCAEGVILQQFYTKINEWRSYCWTWSGI